MTISIESELAAMQTAYRELNDDIKKCEDRADRALASGNLSMYSTQLARADLLSSIKSSLTLIAIGRASALQSVTTLGTALNAYFVFLQGSGSEASNSDGEKSLRAEVVAAMVLLVKESQSLSASSIASAKAKADQAKAEADRAREEAKRTRAEARAANARADIAEMDKDAESKAQESRLRKVERESHGWWWQLFHQ
ncbi:MAG: hypothetical protein LBI69_00730 [Puniceicoccales bacterium]|jgi:hypothetical protein|nr:hypothetical protein [Puniceicoccales bacterium]